jgi:ferritin-like metal-binding protein YciE
MSKTDLTGATGQKKSTDSQFGIYDSTKSESAKSGEKKQKTLKDLFETGLKYAYSGEKQLIEALPEMAKAADSEELQDAFTEHLQQTKRQAERLEKIFDRLQLDKTEEKCAVMEALVNVGKKMIENIESGPVRDSALIIGAQKVEHHEIAAYGSLCELADALGYSKVMEILDRTLEEEENADQNLTFIARHVNDEACEMCEQNNQKEKQKESANSNY